jgi:hypothetical protein
LRSGSLLLPCREALVKASFCEFYCTLTQPQMSHSIPVATPIAYGIGEQLEAHIRLEERAVFPLVEESLSEAALTELAARLEVKEAGPRVEPWVPAEELSYAPWPGPGDSEGGGYDE